MTPWQGFDGQAGFYRQIAQMDQKLTDEIEHRYAPLDCPVTLLWGEQDQWIPISQGHTLAAKLTRGVLTPVPRSAIVPLGLDPTEFHGRTNDVRKAVQRRKREMGPELGFDYSALTDEQLSDISQYDIFPNVIITVKPEEFWIMRPRPHPTDPDKCYFDKWTIAARSRTGSDAAEKLCLMGNENVRRSDERPEHEVFTQDEVIAGKYTMTATIDQDIYLLRQMQAGMHSRGFSRALLRPPSGQQFSMATGK